MGTDRLDRRLDVLSQGAVRHLKHLVLLVEEQLREVGAILARYSGEQRSGTDGTLADGLAGLRRASYGTRRARHANVRSLQISQSWRTPQASAPSIVPVRPEFRTCLRVTVGPASPLT
jgi:hypothetical protein